MTVLGAVAIVAFWLAFASCAYGIGRGFYEWSVRTSLLVGIITGPIGAFLLMIDSFEHTSMGGQNTRKWKNESDGIAPASYEEPSRCQKGVDDWGHRRSVPS